MRYFFLIVLCTSLSSSLLGQDTTMTALQTRLNQYFLATEQKNWNGVLDLLYPKLFTMASREELYDAFAGMDREDMKMYFSDMGSGAFSEPFTYEGENFVVMDYHGTLAVQLDSTKRDSSFVDLLLGIYQSQYGEDKVSYSAKDSRINILLEKKMLAISATDSPDAWYFIEYDPGNQEVMAALVPKEVFAHFKNE